jgi:hypothetical protein
MYNGTTGDALIEPFLAQEIEAAVRGMDRSSAPGPDGLGPSFYRAGWTAVRPSLHRVFDAFFSCSLDLERINRTHIVLLPKKDGVLALSSFRPVSLQNCSVMAICKTLTTRLQGKIGRIIDVDQTGFLTGRSITENFVYATELVQTCFQRRAPCIILKPDFAKAFDSVSC